MKKATKIGLTLAALAAGAYAVKKIADNFIQIEITRDDDYSDDEDLFEDENTETKISEKPKLKSKNTNTKSTSATKKPKTATKKSSPKSSKD